MRASSIRLRLAAAALLGAAAGLVGLTSTAEAAACPKGTGVTVVVNSSVSCNAGGAGQTAASIYGGRLTYAKKQPGFVCRVDGYPASDPCVTTSPADAYWGLFWSNGTSGSWSYSSVGAGSLRIPKGGWVAFVFQNSNSKTYPGMRPIGPAAPRPPSGGSSGGSGSTSGSHGSGSSSTSPSAKKSAEAAKAAEEKAKASTTPSPSASASASADSSAPSDVRNTSEQTDTGTSVPWWAGAGLAVLLAAGAVVVTVRRRSQRES